MWNESFGKEIARILNLMADQPNAQEDSFDGGKKIVMTGLTRFELTDGTTALNNLLEIINVS